ncbi:unnamed protein product [marine sediment metagenome]|uniref:Uncharacterized protein n=1 Tax=marine sediment metagenome TaxID=412755 RepID=X1I3I3_9ZZZZ
MPETPPEKLMGWLTREEEEFGLTGSIERTIDPDTVREMLREELRYEPTEEQVGLMYGAARYKYETLPTIGVRPELYVRPWGKQVTYRDVTTGRFMSREAIETRRIEFGY